MTDKRRRFAFWREQNRRPLHKPSPLANELEMRIETLEPRCMLATFAVTNLNDSGVGSLRQAILDANSNANPGEVDNITFDASLTLGRVLLTTSLPRIAESLSIVGPRTGMDSITIDGQGIADLQPFNIGSTATNVTLTDLTITGGNVTNSGGAMINLGPNTVLERVRVTENVASNDGGGILNQDGVLTVRNAELSNNKTTGFTTSNGGALSNVRGTVFLEDSNLFDNSAAGFGGAILNFNGPMTITRSTLTGNRDISGGGAIVVDGTDSSTRIYESLLALNESSQEGGGINIFRGFVLIVNSTIAHNLSRGSAGGGGLNISNGTVTLVNSTVARNIDISGYAQGAGGIAKSSGTLTIINSIVAENHASAGAVDENVELADIHTSASNYIGADAGIGTLRDNGGPTWSMAPLAGSPVIDAGSNIRATVDGQVGSTPLDHDQRGFTRIVDGDLNGVTTVDIGAVEYAPVQPPTKFFVVNDDGTNTGFFEYDINGNSNGHTTLGGSTNTPKGATTNSDASLRWVVGTKKVFVYDGDNNLLGSWFARQTTSLRGIATNGTDIWVVDSAVDKVFFYAGAASRISGGQDPTSSFDLAPGNDNPEGITTNGNRIWVVDNDPGFVADRVYKYFIGGGANGSFVMPIENRQATGITVDPTNQSKHLWVVDKFQGKIYQYDNGQNLGDGLVHSFSTSWTLDPLNSDPQGIADPLPRVSSDVLAGAGIQTNRLDGNTPRIAPPQRMSSSATLSMFATDSGAMARENSHPLPHPELLGQLVVNNTATPAMTSTSTVRRRESTTRPGFGTFQLHDTKHVMRQSWSETLSDDGSTPLEKENVAPVIHATPTLPIDDQRN
ncbi:MAG: hypothetical protein KDA60_05970 [Planctomycetales bacterium]|nr:hypothetical protein [Planctomycetales bacterium]